MRAVGVGEMEMLCSGNWTLWRAGLLCSSQSCPESVLPRTQKTTLHPLPAESATHYVGVAGEHAKENSLTLEEVAQSKGLVE